MTPIVWKAVGPSVRAKKMYEADRTPPSGARDEHVDVYTSSLHGEVRTGIAIFSIYDIMVVDKRVQLSKILSISDTLQLFN
jgi:hypothetical protein